MENKRQYFEEYLKFGFTPVNNGSEATVFFVQRCRQCWINEAITIETPLVDQSFATREKWFTIFRHHEPGLKHQRFNFIGSFYHENAALPQPCDVAVEVTKEKSLDVSLETVKQKQPHTNGEMLAQSCLLKSLKLLLGEFIEAKMRQISFSNTTI